MGAPPILDINVATRPFRNNTWLWLGVVLGSAAILALTVWNVGTFLEAQGTVQRWTDERTAYEARTVDLRGRDERARQGISQVDVRRLRGQVERANEFIALKAFSWTRLFDRLEGVLPYEVRMQSIRPIFRIQDSKDELAATDLSVPVVVEGTAQSLVAFLEFESNLLASDAFDRVEPERHDLDPATREIVFALRFHYYPQGRASGARERPGAGAAEAGSTAAVPAGERRSG